MKKVMILSIITFFLLASLSAAELIHESLPSQGLSDKIVVTLNLGLDSMIIPGVEVGFSRNEINDMNDNVEVINGSTVDMIFKDDGTHFLVSDDIYVYWKIKGNPNISAELNIPGPLRDRRGDYLDWSAGFEDGSYKIGAEVYYSQALSVFSGRTAYPAAGSRKLEIATMNLNEGNVVPGEYIGELELNISIN